MKETSSERETRRAISKRLTALINDANAYGGVRMVVIRALSLLGERLRELQNTVKRDYQLRPNIDILIYYIKGGNALDALVPPVGAQLVPRFEYGKSDWDTQIVINPWLPIAAQDALNAGIEDIVTDLMLTYGHEIAYSVATAPQDPLSPITMSLQPAPRPADYPAPQTPDADNLTCYVECDAQQVFRKVYERDRSGLHLFTSKPLKSVPADTVIVGPADTFMPAAPPAIASSASLAQTSALPSPGSLSVPPAAQARTMLPPGIILNDAVKPFILYRLGYTWHASWVGDGVDVSTQVTPRPILMELVDVTLPRQDTVEAVTLWSDIVRNQLLITDEVATQNNWPLPLPDVEYHLHEGMTMICEIAADPNWRSADKLEKRKLNVIRIYNWYNGLGQLAVFYRVMDAISGTGIADPNATCEQMIDTCMATVRRRMTPPPNVATAFNAACQAIAQARQTARSPGGIIGRLLGILQCPTNTDCGFSDDLALTAAFSRDRYIDVISTPFSGITTAVVARSDYQTIERAARLDSATLSAPNADPIMTLSTQIHSTMRATGPSHECTIVVLSAPRNHPDARLATALLTLTTAGAASCPFASNPDVPAQNIAPLLDMGEQRKVAAALIQDFVQRDALTKQHRIIGTLLP